MALFKISRGKSANLPANKVNGYCYVTIDEHKLYVDYTKDDGTLDRFALNAVSADQWKTARNLNGMVVNGTSNVVNYGTCSTAAATAAKVVSCSNFALIIGAEITVKFTTTNTAANPTLNVNNTGAKAIYYRGSAISAGYLAANRTYTFRYNGSQYELVGDINTDTNTKVTQTVTTSNATYPLLLAPSGQTATTTTTSYFDSGVTLNPSTNTIVANISGNAATATKLGSSTIGSTTKPIYLNNGTATASNANVGNTLTPVYMNGGTITTTETFGNRLYDYNNSRIYFYSFGGGQDLNWKKIFAASHTATAPSSATYVGATIKGTIYYHKGNYNQAEVDEYPFQMNMVFLSGTSVSNSCSLKVAAGCPDTIIRAVRVSTNNFELQVRQPVDWTKISIQFSYSGSAVTMQAFSPINSSNSSVIPFTILTNSISNYSKVASKLETARTISLTGSVTGSGTFDGSGNLSIATTTNHNHDSNYVKKSGDTMTGQLTVPGFFYNSGDATLKVYASTNTTYGDESISVQTAFDGVDGQTHNYVTQFESRCNLLLQPRGGQVYISKNQTSVGDTAYALLVGGPTHIDGDLTVPTVIGNLNGNASSATNASSLKGTPSNSAVPLTDPGAGIIKYYYNVNSNLTGNMPSVHNGNGILYLNTHSGEYGYQLGFSSDGNIYYRNKNSSAFTSSVAWDKILSSGNYTSYTVKKDGTGASGTWGISISGNAATASKVNNKLTVGSKTFDGSAAVTIAASDLGLASAMLFLGTTTTAISDGATTNPVTIGGANRTVTAGNVVLYGSKEFVWTGSAWEELGNEGSYKIVQEAVADPTASGTSNTFIATISQDANGKITATKKTVAVTNSAPTLSWGATSTIGSVAGTNLQVKMPANPNTDTKVTQTVTSSDASYPLLLAPNGQTATTTTTSYFNSGVTLNPSTKTITATTFAGNLKGNADTATKLQTARTISLTGSVTGSGTFDGSDNLSITTTTNHTHSYLPLSGGTVTGDLTIQKTSTISANSPATLNFKTVQSDNNVTSSAYIRVYDDHDTTPHGTNMVIQSAGNIIIGSGESPSACYSTDLINSASENMYITSDNSIYFYTNCNTYADKKTSVYINNAGALYGAVWNDYAEFRICKDNFKPGQVVLENGDDTLSIANQRLQRGCSITSDTFGFAIGETDEAKCPIAVSGRVLAYGYESREEFAQHIGWPVCSGPNGTVSIMTEEEEEKYPSRIIGTISAVPDYETWGTGNVSVNGRIWIKIR